MSIPQERLEAALADRYAIEREIGRGGSAVVYLAHDVLHGRSVAIKVLSPSLAADLAAERFLREIEISAALTHPYILPPLDSGLRDGFLFYVMPYVDGESLRDRLEREGELPVGDALRIAREVAEGLAHAHARGVVHRDIKPGNVLLSGRHAMIADFGVARALRRAAGERGKVAGSRDEKLTGTGLAVGTPLYMSPEQAAGDERVDARSDIYALGCLLYEMLTGRPPLAGRTPDATLARRMTETPAPIRNVRETVSPEVERAVMRALARSPADRYRSAESMARALRAAAGAAAWTPDAAAANGKTAARPRSGVRTSVWWRAPSVGAGVLGALVVGALVWGVFAPGRTASSSSGDEPSSVAAVGGLTEIAVLPFAVRAPGQDLEYLAGGLTRSLIDELGKVEALKVRSYHSVEPYRGVTVPPDSIGRALRVGILIGGGVEESSGQVRVRVELADVETGTSLARSRVQRPRGEPFELQDEIAGEVARFLREKLGVEVRLEARRSGTRNARAWELVERAEEARSDWRPLWRAGNMDAAVEALERADSLLARAAALDRRWVEPVVLRGWVAERLAILVSPVPQRYDRDRALRALELAEGALELQPGNARALELRGTLRYGLHWLASNTATAESLLDGAERDLRAAVAAEPSLASAWARLSELLEYARADYREAHMAAKRAYEEDAFLTDADDILMRLASTSLNLGDAEAALRRFSEGARRFPDNVGFPAAELVSLASDVTEPDVEQAWELYRTISALTTSPSRKADYDVRSRLLVAAVLARAGLLDSARSTLRRVHLAAGEQELARASYEEARARLLMGDREGALAALARHLESDPHDRTFIAEDPWFEELRDDPAFHELAEGER